MSEQTAEGQAYTAEQVAEWSKWVAKEAIYDGTALAFNVGDPVPASHVERGVVRKDQVVGAKTKAAEAVTAPPKEG